MVAKCVIFVYGRLFDLKKLAKWCVMNKCAVEYYEEIVEMEEYPEWYESNPHRGPLTESFKKLPRGWYKDFCDVWMLNQRQLTCHFDNNVNVFQYPCCSPLAEKYLIVGIERKRYTRISGEPWHDDGTVNTENGLYNFSEIFDSVVQIDEKNVCDGCYYHFNRPTPSGSTLSEQSSTPSGSTPSECPKCKATRRVNDDYVNLLPTTKELKKFICEAKGFYLTLDDCASCT